MGDIPLAPLVHRGLEGLQCGLHLAVLFAEPLGCTCGLFSLVLRGVTLLSSNNALLTSFVVLPKSVFKITVGGAEVGLEPLYGSQQLVTFCLHLLGHFLVLVAMIKQG